LRARAGAELANVLQTLALGFLLFCSCGAAPHTCLASLATVPAVANDLARSKSAVLKANYSKTGLQMNKQASAAAAAHQADADVTDFCNETTQALPYSLRLGGSLA
jgi:hypothetical protein